MENFRDKTEELSQKVEQKYKNSERREKIRKYKDSFNTERTTTEEIIKEIIQENNRGLKHTSLRTVWYITCLEQ